MFLAPVLYVIYALLYGIFTDDYSMHLVFVQASVILRRCYGPLYLRILPACSTEDMADSSTGNRSIYRILCGIPISQSRSLILRLLVERMTILKQRRTVELSKVMTYTAIAAKLSWKVCGGKENITSIDNCVTRLRLEIKGYTQL